MNARDEYFLLAWLGSIALAFASATISYWSMVFMSNGGMLDWSEVVLSCVFGLLFFQFGFSYLFIKYLVSEGYL